MTTQRATTKSSKNGHAATKPYNLAQELIAYYKHELADACEFSDPCGTGEKSQKCQKAIAAYEKHEVQCGVFIRRRNPTARSGKTFTAFEMETILNSNPNARCSSHVIAFDRTVKDNAALRPLVMGTIPDLGEPECKYVYFGFELFKGILLDNPLSLTFYLAFNKGQNDVIFSAQCPNGKPDRHFVGSNILHEPAPPRSGSESPPYSEDELYCMSVARAHSIRVETFQSNLDNFWDNTPVPPAYVIIWDVLDSILDISKIRKERVSLTWRTNDLTNNTLTGFVVFLSPAELVDMAPNEMKTFYSVEVFFGIHLINNAQEFRFYKGRSDQGDLTILIEAIGFDGSHQYYDLSNDRP